MALRRKVQRLVNDHRSSHPAFFLSKEVHLQSSQPIHLWGLDYSRLSHRVELVEVSNSDIYGTQPYLAIKNQ